MSLPTSKLEYLREKSLSSILRYGEVVVNHCQETKPKPTSDATSSKVQCHLPANPLLLTLSFQRDYHDTFYQARVGNTLVLTETLKYAWRRAIWRRNKYIVLMEVVEYALQAYLNKWPLRKQLTSSFSTIALSEGRPYVLRQHWLYVDLLQVTIAKILSFYSSQMHPQPSGQNIRSRPHVDSDVFQRYSQLCAGNVRPRSSVHNSPTHTAPLKGITSDIQITTSGCVKRMSLLDVDSDVFQRYSQLCARNVRPRFSADFLKAGCVNNFEPHANYYSQLCTRNAGAAIPEQYKPAISSLGSTPESSTAKDQNTEQSNIITTGTPPSSPKSKYRNTKHRVMTTTGTLHRQAAADNQPQKEICRKVHGSGHITKNELEEAGNKFLTDGAPRDLKLVIWRGFKVDQKLMHNTELPADIKANVVVAKDRSGKYKKTEKRKKRFMIYVVKGIYYGRRHSYYLLKNLTQVIWNPEDV
ncbi:hypothetical protein Tco_0625444 [Tanacetum coccineum]|uniref:Uncharacterized protein n=1 Tax=Tanacetum coccineum TaxID=301880 RepID=A0ABQ4WGT6_9ASTR